MCALCVCISVHLAANKKLHSLRILCSVSFCDVFHFHSRFIFQFCVFDLKILLECGWRMRFHSSSLFHRSFVGEILDLNSTTGSCIFRVDRLICERVSKKFNFLIRKQDNCDCSGEGCVSIVIQPAQSLGSVFINQSHLPSKRLQNLWSPFKAIQKSWHGFCGLGRPVTYRKGQKLFTQKHLHTHRKAEAKPALQRRRLRNVQNEADFNYVQLRPQKLSRVVDYEKNCKFNKQFFLRQSCLPMTWKGFRFFGFKNP